MQQYNWLSLLFLSLALNGCMQPIVKAPCNASGSDCGQKIKINQWATP